MRTLLKTSKYGLGRFLALFVAYVALLVYPGALFANSAQYNGIAVHSDADLTGVETILRNIERALETSEVYDPTLEHDIVFGHGNAPFTIIQRFHGRLTKWATGMGGPPPSYNASWPTYVSNNCLRRRNA